MRRSKEVDALFMLNFDLSNIQDPCDTLFSRQEIFFTRKRLKKGIGNSLCNNDHIRKLDFGGIDTLFQYLFNFYFDIGYWPAAWRLVTVFPLIKGGDRNAWDPGDYRGISIAPLSASFSRKLFIRDCSSIAVIEFMIRRVMGVLEMVLYSKSSRGSRRGSNSCIL